MINNVSAAREGQIKPVETSENKLKCIEEDILENYEKTPIIVFYEEDLKNDLLVMCQRNNFKRNLMGSSLHILK